MRLRKRDTPEKRVESAIIRNLKKLGFRVTKTSQPRPSMITLGVPDLYVSHWRWKVRLWIEVKAPSRRTEKNGGLTTDQVQWARDERAAGGDVMVAYSMDDVVEALKLRGVPIT